MKRYMAIIGAIIGTATVLALAPVWFGWEVPPWAKVSDVRDLNSRIDNVEFTGRQMDEFTLRIALDNAFKRGDKAQIRRLCDLLTTLTKIKPSGCP